MPRVEPHTPTLITGDDEDEDEDDEEEEEEEEASDEDDEHEDEEEDEELGCWFCVPCGEGTCSISWVVFSVLGSWCS